MRVAAKTSAVNLYFLLSAISRVECSSTGPLRAGSACPSNDTMTEPEWVECTYVSSNRYGMSRISHVCRIFNLTLVSEAVAYGYEAAFVQLLIPFLLLPFSAKFFRVSGLIQQFECYYIGKHWIF